MIELKKAGLYIANGKNTSVLIRVVGEYPMFSIVSGVLLNDMEKDGTVTVLHEDNHELQDILCNPKDYIFDLPAISEAITHEKGLDTNSKKILEYTEEDFRNWVDIYKQYKVAYPKQHDIKMTIYLMKNGNFSKNQAELVIKQLCVRLRTQNR